MKATRILLAAAIGMSSMALTGCMTDTPDTAAEQKAMTSDAQAALNKMYERDLGLRSFVEGSHGYAIFPSVGKAGLVVGGSSGRGEVYEQGRLVGYSTLNSLSAGPQVGGQELAELIVFENEEALRRFQNNETTFTLTASAVAVKAGASDEAVFKDGVAVFTLPTGGFMAEVAVAGQQFQYEPLDASAARMNDSDPSQATYRSTTTTDRNVDVDANRTGQERRIEIKTETEMNGQVR